MKDKRTVAEKESNKRFIKALAEQSVVLCKFKIKVVPPSGDEPKNEKVWTLMIDQGISDVVIAWYKTREPARRHARRLRTALTNVL